MLQWLLNWFSLLDLKEYEYIIYIPSLQTHIAHDRTVTKCGMVIESKVFKYDYNEEGKKDNTIYVCAACVYRLPDKVLSIYEALEKPITID